MKYEELIILLPCHSLEDFPLYHEKEAAEGLLSAWTAMWHPALLADCGKAPTWARADSPPAALAGRLLIVPQVSESLLQAGWAARAQSEGGHVVRKTADRAAILKSALGALDHPPETDPPLAGDFLALGLCFLQVELLTRQMRYMSNLDEKHFHRCVLDAARASMAGDVDAARAGLQACFDVLMEARERFYPAQAYLLDITLVAPTTLGPALIEELLRPTPRSMLASAATIAEMRSREPATFDALRAALERGTLTLVGGESTEQEFPLLPVESILAGLRRGGDEYRRHLGVAPSVFGRRRFGLTPALPQILARSGYRGAVHFTLDEGQFPREGQSKTRWEGFDSSAIDTLARVPLDADLPETFLSFPQKMGETMDLDHVAVVGFAHWPGQYRPWFDDLRRIAAYAPVLGRFVTIEEFLSASDASGYLSKFTADQYRAPYLKQAVIRRQGNPLSRFVEHYRRRATADAARAVGTLAALLSGGPPSMTNDPAEAVEAALLTETVAADLDGQLDESLTESMRRFAGALPRSTASAGPGLLIVNPLSFARRINVSLPDTVPVPDVASPVMMVQDAPESRYVSVDLPAMGFAWIGDASASPRKKKSAEKPLAEDNLLRNEFCEVIVDPQSGGIRSVHDYKHRGNRLSQQLGFRLPGPRPKPGDVWRDPDLEAQYAGMVADSIEIVSAGPVLGEIVSRGRLEDPSGRRIAGFEQLVQVWRGSPIIVLDIRLDPTEEPRADAWNSYYAARFAWADEAADLFRGVNQATQPTEAKKLEAPLFVELRAEKFRTAILTGGLPYHRRIGLRMLDSLLIVRGEQARRFRLGIGLDLPYPQANAWELLTPSAAITETAAPPASGATGWLCHVDLRNILATHWEPLVENGVVAGFIVRLLETEGRPGRARLRAFRSIGAARQVDFRGETLVTLPLDNGAVQVDFTAHEWVQVEARWA